MLTNHYTWEEIGKIFIKKLMAYNSFQNKGEIIRFYRWFCSKSHFQKLAFDCRVYFSAFKVSERFQRKQDCVTVIDGAEGSGKTTFAMNYAALISPDFDLDDVCFGSIKFLKKLRYIKPGQTVLADEGANFLFSRESNKKSNTDVIKMLTMVRCKRGNIIVNIPNFHIIDNYLRDHRVKLLVHIIKRGYHKVINEKGIKIISKLGGKHKEINNIRLNSKFFFNGNFNKGFPNTLDEQAYEKMKDDYVNDSLDTMIQNSGEKSKFVQVGKAAKKTGLSNEVIISRIKNKDIEGKRIGGMYYITRESYESLLKL